MNEIVEQTWTEGVNITRIKRVEGLCLSGNCGKNFRGQELGKHGMEERGEK